MGEELTGVDIMPFAAHLTALNLALQSPLEPTDRTRVGIGNSLNLLPGREVSTTAQWIRLFGKEVVPTEEEESKEEVFRVGPVDVVIMNPPFTRKERVSPEMKSPLYAHLGEQNYWAYFVALADKFVKGKGRIAAVLPRDFFRGKYSRVLREYLFKDRRWGIRYIVKSTKDWAFSEQAAFRDFLVVLERGYQGKLALAYFSKPLNSLTLVEAGHIGETVRLVEEGQPYSDDSVAVVWREQGEVWEKCSDLGSLVMFNTPEGDVLVGFYEGALVKGGERLAKMRNITSPHITVIRGLEPQSEGILNLLFLVRPLEEKRMAQSKLMIVSEDASKVIVKAKNFARLFEVPCGATVRGVKTPSYLARMDVTDISDVVISKPFPHFEDIRRLIRIESVDFSTLKQRAKCRFAHLVVSYKFDFTAPGTKAVAFFSKRLLLPSKALWSVVTHMEVSRVLCLWFNSILGILQLLSTLSEIRGSYIRINGEMLEGFQVPHFGNVATIPLLEAFEQVKDMELPPLWEQFRNPPPARLIIDRAVLKFLGYPEKEIDDLLPEVYEALDQEMRSLKELMKGTPKREKEQERLQLHLFAQE